MPVTEQQPRIKSPATRKPLSSKQLASTLRRDQIRRLKDRLNDFVKYASNEEIGLLREIVETREGTTGYQNPHPGVPIADAFESVLAGRDFYVCVEREATRDAVCEFMRWFESPGRHKQAGYIWKGEERNGERGPCYVLVSDWKQAEAVQEFIKWSPVGLSLKEAEEVSDEDDE